MNYQNISGSVPWIEVRHSLPSRIEYIEPIVDHLMEVIGGQRADDSKFDIEIALQEALANAIIHGNYGDPGKQVEVSCRCGVDGAVDITIRDEGEGFDCRHLPDPTLPENRMSGHGRGIYLMCSLMDEIRYGDGGRTVHMRKNPTRNMPERLANGTRCGDPTEALQAARR